MGKTTRVRVKLVFDDWRRKGYINSIYDTELGIELSWGDLHSGTVFDAVIEVDNWMAGDLVYAWQEYNAFPVFCVMDSEFKKESWLWNKVSGLMCRASRLRRGAKSLLRGIMRKIRVSG